LEGQNAVCRVYDTFLGNMRTPHEQIYVDTRFGKAFVIAACKKDAPELILLYGSGFNSVMWIEDMEKYSQYYRVYAVDLQGEPGKSDGKQLRRYSSNVATISNTDVSSCKIVIQEVTAFPFSIPR